MNTKSATVFWELINRLAATTLRLRISGEKGAGKEAIARLLHRHYPSENAKFFKFDGRNLIKKRSAPSATADFYELVDSPQNTVLYIENIESASKEIQHRLLELLKTHFSSNPPWILASSQHSLKQYAGNEQFNTPLFHALNTLHIELIPLRSKREKIPQILSWFLNHLNSKHATCSLPMPDIEEMDYLINYHWPNNWRQLKAVVRNAFENQVWDVTLIDPDNDDGNNDDLDGIAALHIISMAKLEIHKDNVMEQMVAASNLEELGLLDLAIVNEAVNQMVDHIDTLD